MTKHYIEKCVALLLVLTMQTVYMKLLNSYIDILLSGMLLVAVAILIFSKDGKIHIIATVAKNVFIACVIIAFLPILQLIFLDKINYSATLLITVMFTVLWGMFVIYFTKDCYAIKKLFENLLDVIYYITLIDLVLYFVGQVFHIISPTGLVTISWGGSQYIKHYLYILFEAQARNYHSFKNGRFTGIFTEAPMCSFILCSALIIMFFLSERKLNKFRLVVIYTAIYTTVSTAGYIVSILAGLGYLITKKADNKFLSLIKFFVCCVASVIVVYNVFEIYQIKQVADVASVQVRNENFQSAIKYFLQSPIIGHGYKSDSLGVVGGDTSVFSQVLQQGGLIMSIWYFIPIVLSLLKFLRNQKWNFLIAELLYILMLYVTVVTYTGFAIAINAILYSVIIVPDLLQNNKNIQVEN